MDYQEGYVYHIKDRCFAKVNNPNLMQNKENGNYCPTFFYSLEEAICDSRLRRNLNGPFDNAEDAVASMLEN